MAKKNINSRVDGVTKDVVPGEPEERAFRFPSFDIVVKAKTYQEALEIYKGIIKQ